MYDLQIQLKFIQDWISAYFNYIFFLLFQTNPCQHPIIILRDVKEQDLRSLLKFMYNGEIQISETRLAEFLKTADTLQIQGLADGAATAIPTGKGRREMHGYGGHSADEDERYNNDDTLNNGDRGSDADDDIEEISRHEKSGSRDGKDSVEGMTNLLRSQRLRRRHQQGRSDNVDYDDDIAIPDDDDEERPTFNSSKRRDQCPKASSVSFD